jgi:3-isopropylmalate/(R)-2-methylmalate dehydratase small subunit
MIRFDTLTAAAVPLMEENIDTDQLCPKQHLTAIKRVGFGAALFSDRRADPAGFILDHPEYASAAILVTGPNFGCGSSREHAVWALVDFGIRCVIAPSFGEIFLNNSVNSGLLAIKLPPEAVENLAVQAADNPGALWTVNLRDQTITTASGQAIAFDIEAHRKHRLLEGLDEISVTLEHGSALAAFEQHQRRSRPWLWNAHPQPQHGPTTTDDKGA